MKIETATQTNLRHGGRSLPLVLGAAVLALLVSGSLALAETAVQGVQRPRIVSPFSAYLAGSHAVRQRDTGAAADYFATALRASPGNPALKERTFLYHLSDGRMREAATLARDIVKTTPKSGGANLLLGLEAAKRGRWTAAIAHFDNLPKRGENGLLVPLLKAWARFGLRDPDRAVQELKVLAGRSGYSNFYDLHNGLILDLAGRRKQAERHYVAVYKRNPLPPMRVAEALASFYWRTGAKAKARKVYRDYLNDHPNAITMERALKRLNAGRPNRPLASNAVGGMAEALFNLASALHQERATQRALAYARLASFLRPVFAGNQLLIAGILDDQRLYDRAVEMYRAIPKSSAYSWPARLAAVRDLHLLKRSDEAVRLLEKMAAERPDRWDGLFMLGNLHRANEAYKKAIDAYDRAVKRIPKLDKRHWNILYQRGIALERAKQWKRAEKDFLKALEFEPDRPFVLNYLAYSWVERGQNLARARAMLEKAVKRRPRDGAITDSLGWILFRTGSYKKAVKWLEKAAELRPQDPVINDHLGDAYWQVGRRHEARFQWRRALSYDPEKEEIPIIKDKLRSGMKPPKKLVPKD